MRRSVNGWISVVSASGMVNGAQYMLASSMMVIKPIPSMMSVTKSSTTSWRSTERCVPSVLTNSGNTNPFRIA